MSITLPSSLHSSSRIRQIDPTRPLCRSQRRTNINANSDNANDEFTQILDALSLDDLKELRGIMKLPQIPTFVKRAELQPFINWRNKTTSISGYDIIISSAIDEAIKDKEQCKEEEPSPIDIAFQNGSQVTQTMTIENKSFNGNDEPEHSEAIKNQKLRKDAPEFIMGIGSMSGGNNSHLPPIDESSEESNGDDDELCDDDDREFDLNDTEFLDQLILSKDERDVAPASSVTSASSSTSSYSMSVNTNTSTSTVQNMPCSPSTSSESSTTTTTPQNINQYTIASNASNSPPPYASSVPMQTFTLPTFQTVPVQGYLVGYPQFIAAAAQPTVIPVAAQPVYSAPAQPLYPAFDISAHLQTLQQIPQPSFFTNTVPTTSVPIQSMTSQPVLMPMSTPNVFSPPSIPVSAPMTNQINYMNNNTVTQPILTQTQIQPTEQKVEELPLAKSGSVAVPSKTKRFEAKFNNHAKGNFYISKEMIALMILWAMEKFNTDTENDEKLAFGHYKESVAMSINDGQIDNIFETEDGKLMIIINIDLHFATKNENKMQNEGDVMYLIAMENEEQFRQRVRWCIVDFMSETQILHKYSITQKDLPKSSRNMNWFKDGMNRKPINLKPQEIDRILRNTHFKSLPKKTSKRQLDKNEKIHVRKSRISQQKFRRFVKQSLQSNKSPIVPVVVIKGKNQCIEWKKFVRIIDDDGYEEWVGISMKYQEGNKQWKIECMDYDSGRVYYQHRLASLSPNDANNFSYKQIKEYITTTLDIYEPNRNYYYNNYRNNNNCYRR